MKKRIGNDIPIEVSVTRNGQPEDLSALASLSVQIKSAYGHVLPFDYLTDGNVIKGVFWGKDQTDTGKYLIELVENRGIKGMASLDAELVTLVDRTSKEADADDTGLCVSFDIQPEGINMSATITAAKNGLSAYELAVLDGFVGTLSEWLESLRGKDGLDAYELAVDRGFSGTYEEWQESLRGPRGHDGSTLYPTFRVERATMHLKMDTMDSGTTDRVTFKDGHLILNI